MIQIKFGPNFQPKWILAILLGFFLSVTTIVICGPIFSKLFACKLASFLWREMLVCQLRQVPIREWLLPGGRAKCRQAGDRAEMETFERDWKCAVGQLLRAQWRRPDKGFLVIWAQICASQSAPPPTTWRAGEQEDKKCE